MALFWPLFSIPFYGLARSLIKKKLFPYHQGSFPWQVEANYGTSEKENLPNQKLLGGHKSLII